MSVIIGSSNVYRFYKSELVKSGRNYSMIRCTDITGFKAIMANLETSDTEVIVSVLENFLATSARSVETEEAISEAMGESLSDFVAVMKRAATTNPATKFAIARPLWRPKYDWYQANLDDVQHTLSETIAALKLANLSDFEAIPEGCQQFEDDQIHLTADSGKIFVEGLLKGAETIFETELVVLDSDPDPDTSTDVQRLEKRIDQLEGQVRARQISDNVIFARIREDLDATANKSKEDRIIITGITSRTAAPTDPESRKVWIKDIVAKIFETILPGFAGKIFYVNQMNSKGLHLPMVEVKLDSVGSASAIRKAFAEKKKAEGSDLGRLFVSNSVNLATRVRVDILKAIARKITDKNFVAHTVPFVSRPVMHLRPVDTASTNQTSKTFTFVDAVVKFGHLLRQVELGDAYRRAGTTFKGQLEQQFIILKESRESGARAARPPGPELGAAAGTSRKRKWEDDDGWRGRGGFKGRPRGKGSRR